MLTQKEIQEAAWHLADSSPFREICPSGRYHLYSAVPLSEIQYNDTPIDIRASDLGPSVLIADVLICVAFEVRLAVFFGQPDWRQEAWFSVDGVLHGLRSIWVPDPNSEELMKQVGAAVWQELQLADADADLRRPDFTLDMSPLECTLPPNAEAVLTENGFLAQDGTVTEAGIQYGIFADVSDGVPIPVVSERTSRSLLDTVFPPPENTVLPVSFAEQLRRMRAGIPTDDCLIRQTVAEMQQLLDLPLTEFFRLNAEYPAKAEYRRFLQAAAQARKMLASCPEVEQKVPKTETFSDAIRLSWVLNECIRPCDEQVQAARGINTDLLGALCDAAVLQEPSSAEDYRSLRHRLHHRDSVHLPLYQVLELPIDHYIYCACVLCRSYDPDWVFRNRLVPYMLSGDPEEGYSIMQFLKDARRCLERDDFANRQDGFYLLYYALVRPLAVGCNTAVLGNPVCTL